MSKIISIATSNPAYPHAQHALYTFADKVYSKDAIESRKLRFLYHHSGIETRYSVLEDFSLPAAERSFFPVAEDLEPFPGIEARMTAYETHAPTLSCKAIEDCIAGKIDKAEITHLITVSCTGMSAPGLDLQIMEQMELQQNIHRSSVNFMGCYAAIHALKIADAYCRADQNAKVIVVCTELCTLHFQKDITQNNILSSLLFSDGSAAMLITGDTDEKGFKLENFYAEVAFKGKQDMSWAISSKGFLMTLTGYVPELIKADFEGLVSRALAASRKTKDDIELLAIHPGGKKILEVIEESLHLPRKALAPSYAVLKENGNMSSASIVFVLKKMLTECLETDAAPTRLFGAAFGPGLTMETFTAIYD